MDDKTREYLEDTHDILVSYDGCHTVESLKGLVDETRERIALALRGEIQD